MGTKDAVDDIIEKFLEQAEGVEFEEVYGALTPETRDKLFQGGKRDE